MNARLTRRFGVVLSVLTVAGCALQPSSDSLSRSDQGVASTNRAALAENAGPASGKKSLKEMLASLTKGAAPAKAKECTGSTCKPTTPDAVDTASADNDSDGIAKGALLSDAIPDVSKFHQVGNASWYGNRFHGRRTASGERYNMDEMTAAHRSLPLLSYVRVTNEQNHRSVVVKINDRGPFRSKRILDLSRAAATALGMRQDGTERVAITGLSPKEARAAKADSLLASR